MSNEIFYEVLNYFVFGRSRAPKNGELEIRSVCQAIWGTSCREAELCFFFKKLAEKGFGEFKRRYGRKGNRFRFYNYRAFLDQSTRREGVI